MISVVVCTPNISNIDIHKAHYINSADTEIEYIVIDNSKNHYSLSSAYNAGVKKASGKILLFTHDDAFPVQNGWDKILEDKFNENKSIGAVGVAGTEYLFEDNVFWTAAGKPYLCGKVIHEPPNDEIFISIYSDSNEDREVVVADGLFLAIKAELFTEDLQFDENLFNNFHFYDLDICMQIREKYKIIVTQDILVKHRSGGVFGETWKNYSRKFIQKYKNRLPTGCSDSLPSKNNRIPISTLSLKTILEKKTVEYIESIGKSAPINDELYKLASTLYNNKQFKKAENTITKLLSKTSPHSNMYHLRALCRYSHGKLIEAYSDIEEAIKLNSQDPTIFYNGANILIDMGKNREALQLLNKTIQLKSNFIPALNKLSYLFSLLGELSLAEKTCKTILKKEPKNFISYNNLGNVYKSMGKIEEALECYKKAISIKPDYIEAYSNSLLTSHYLIDNQRDLWNLHKDFSSNCFPNSFKKFSKKTKNRKIRIAYLSPDFRIHSVSYFIKPILENHNQNLFEIYCYHDNNIYDEVTLSLKSTVCHWKDIAKLSNTEVATLIQKDNIDILIDLAGHSGENRIPLFAQRIAPLQITYLGYPDTSGLENMDYRITDINSETPDSKNLHSEELIQLPVSFLCYSKPEIVPEIKYSNTTENEIILGSLNNYSKISEATLKIWSEILKVVPNAKFLIKNKSLKDEFIKKDLLLKFNNHNISCDRILIHSYSNEIEEHLNFYNNIDLAVDTFPYNGTTTTCEALLMGVPTLTLIGDTHASRVSSSILKSCNLAKYSAETIPELINIAKKLCETPKTLKSSKQNIRDAFLDSIICKPKKFMKDFEKSLIIAFEKWKQNV